MKTKIVALAGVLLAAMPDIVRACSVCFTDGDAAVSRAFNWSIAFLMAAPYLVIGSIGGSLFYLYRRAASKSETQKESSQPVAPWRGIRRKAEDE
jgi:hypothetical protein